MPWLPFIFLSSLSLSSQMVSPYDCNFLQGPSQTSVISLHCSERNRVEHNLLTLNLALPLVTLKPRPEGSSLSRHLFQTSLQLLLSNSLCQTSSFNSGSATNILALHCQCLFKDRKERKILGYNRVTDSHLDLTPDPTSRQSCILYLSILAYDVLTVS